MTQFSVPKMKCGGCADAVRNALHKLDAKAPVTVDLDSKLVEFDGAASQDAVLEALVAAGYPATVAR